MTKEEQKTLLNLKPSEFSKWMTRKKLPLSYRIKISRWYEENRQFQENVDEIFNQPEKLL